MKLAWKALVAFGIILIFAAFTMDTTLDAGSGRRVHNIGLQGEQQMLLVLGCVAFLAGVILFAVAKLKQTPQEDQDDRDAFEKAIGPIRMAKEEVHRKAAAKLEELERKPPQPPKDRQGARLGAGIFVGLIQIGLASSFIRTEIVVLFLLVPLFYAFWPQWARVAITRLMLANLAGLFIFFVILMSKETLSLSAFLSNQRMMLGVLLLFVIPAVISVIVLVRQRRDRTPTAT